MSGSRRTAFVPASSRLVLAALALALGAAVLAVELRLVEYAFERIGIGSRTLFALLAASIAGSWINIPVFRLRGEAVVSLESVRAFGVRYVLPVVERGAGTVVAVNVGGAIVPVLVSCHLLWASAAGGLAGPLLATALVTVAVHWAARPVPGLGIAVPTLLAPLVAAAGALLLAPEAPARAAYVAGTLGSLIGADLLNLGRIRGLGAPVASIGGAGTFDGIFVAGVLAALLA
jgi:uncharacterized membrane protein